MLAETQVDGGHAVNGPVRCCRVERIQPQRCRHRSVQVGVDEKRELDREARGRLLPVVPSVTEALPKDLKEGVGVTGYERCLLISMRLRISSDFSVKTCLTNPLSRPGPPPRALACPSSSQPRLCPAPIAVSPMGKSAGLAPQRPPAKSTCTSSQ